MNNFLWKYNPFYLFISNYNSHPEYSLKRPNLEYINNLELIIFGMDGVLRTNNKPINIAVESFNKIKKKNIPICIITNECRRSPKKIKRELKNMGYDLTNVNFISSNFLMLKKIENICYDNRKQNIGIISNQSFCSYIESNTKNKIKKNNPNFYFIDNNIFPNNIDYFIIGCLDIDSYNKYKNSISKWFLNNKNAKIILTCTDENNIDNENILPKKIFNLYPEKNKEFDFVGKSNKAFILEEIKNYYGINKINNEKILMIGDKLETDIEFANNNKFNSCLVLSGITKLENLNKDISKKIDYIIPDISYLCF